MTEGTGPGSVLIVGAGPAGLTAAMRAKALGWRVTVLEKEAVVGGKCHSLHHEGVAYDLGANLTTPRYTFIRGLAEELGLTRRHLQDRRIVNLSEEDFPSLQDASLLKRLLVRGSSSLYIASRALSGVQSDGYGGLPPSARQPFSVWLERHGLAPFREVFANLFVAYGYGLMDDLPAAYALKFFDKVHLRAAIDVILGEDVDSTMDFEEGFGELWERVDKRYEIGTHRSARLLQVHRSPRGVASVWQDGEGTTRVQHFDRLIVACPLDVALSFLDSSPDEARLFSQLRYYDYYVTAARVRGVDKISTYLQPYAVRWTPAQPTVFYPPRADSDLYLFYAYGEAATTVEEVRANIEATLADEAFRGELLEYLTTQHWRYFPHVSAHAMAAGFYDDLDAMQGRFNTWYVGELLSFSLVELIHLHARDVIDRAF